MLVIISLFLTGINVIAIENNVEVYRRYLRIKAKLLKLPKLTCADVMAPLPDAPHKKYSWADARSLVMEAFSKFNDTFEEYAKDMYDDENFFEATNEFTIIILRFPGSSVADSAQFYLGMSHYQLEEYIISGAEFSKLINNTTDKMSGAFAGRALKECSVDKKSYTDDLKLVEDCMLELYSDLSVKSIKLVKEDATSALVEAVVQNNKIESKAKIALIKVDGKWKVAGTE